METLEDVDAMASARASVVAKRAVIPFWIHFAAVQAAVDDDK
jgi:hypothetical protein